MIRLSLMIQTFSLRRRLQKKTATNPAADAVAGAAVAEAVVSEAGPAETSRRLAGPPSGTAFRQPPS